MSNETASIVRKIAVIDMDQISLQEERQRLVTDLKRTCLHDNVQYALGKWVTSHEHAVAKQDKYYAFGAAYCADCDSFFTGEEVVREMAALPGAIERSLPQMRYIGKNVAHRGNYRLVRQEELGG